MFKKKDFIIIFIIFIVIIGALLFNHFYFSQKAAYVKITVNNQVYRTVPLEIDQTIKISDKNMIVINHGSVHMKMLLALINYVSNKERYLKMVNKLFVCLIKLLLQLFLINIMMLIHHPNRRPQ